MTDSDHVAVKFFWKDQMSLRIAFEGLPKAIYWGFHVFFIQCVYDFPLNLMLCVGIIGVLAAIFTGGILIQDIPWETVLLSIVCLSSLWSLFIYFGMLIPPQVSFEKCKVVIGERSIKVEDIVNIQISESTSSQIVNIASRLPEGDVIDDPLHIVRNESTKQKLDDIKAWCEQRNICVEMG